MTAAQVSEQAPHLDWHQFAAPQNSIPVPVSISETAAVIRGSWRKELVLRERHTAVIASTAAEPGYTLLIDDWSTSFTICGNSGCAGRVRWHRPGCLTIAKVRLASCTTIK